MADLSADTIRTPGVVVVVESVAVAVAVELVGSTKAADPRQKSCSSNALRDTLILMAFNTKCVSSFVLMDGGTIIIVRLFFFCHQLQF